MDKLSMNQAALILGVSRQTLYNKHSGKTALQILNDEIARLEDELETIKANRDILVKASPADMPR